MLLARILRNQPSSVLSRFWAATAHLRFFAHPIDACFAPQPVSVDWRRVLLSKCSLSNASQSAGSDALVVMSGLARQPSQRGGSERDHPTPPLLLLLVLGLFSNSISAESNDGLWKARLAPPPRRGKVPRRRGLASICSSPFWVSIFLGPFPLLLQIARNSENNFSTTAGAAVCDQWGSPDRPEGQDCSPFNLLGRPRLLI
jgi:hypothetical protein